MKGHLCELGLILNHPDWHVQVSMEQLGPVRVTFRVQDTDKSNFGEGTLVMHSHTDLRTIASMLELAADYSETRHADALDGLDRDASPEESVTDPD